MPHFDLRSRARARASTKRPRVLAATVRGWRKSLILLSSLLVGGTWIATGCDGSDTPDTKPDHAGEEARAEGGAHDAGRAQSVDARVVLPIDNGATKDAGSSLPVPVDGGTRPSTPEAGLPDASSSTGLKICGGIAALPCAADEFCSQEDSGSGLGCGFADSSGACEPRTQICTAIAAPVCGCDGKTYATRCTAHAVGVSVSKAGACADAQDLSCDERKVLCKRARPVCPAGQVPSVVETCWGECVLIDRCACKAADECPQRDTYVCHMSAAHCGPYVN